MPEPQLRQIDDLLRDLDQAEQRLAELQDALQRSHRLVTLGTVASIIAHEFNNLLTPVVSYAQIALQSGVENDPDLARKALQRSEQGASRAAEIAHSILGFARGGESDGPCQFTATLDEALRCLARQPQKDNIELTVDVPDDLWIAMAPVALQQVLMNLVLNARRAMGRAGGRLTIAAERQHDRAVIDIADTGPGIDPAQRESIFQPFVSSDAAGDGDASDPGRSEHTGETADSGTGLGLAICRTLVEEAGGTIVAAEPRPGEGARFRLDLSAAS
jgi:signal transduction histidine kinase